MRSGKVRKKSMRRKSSGKSSRRIVSKKRKRVSKKSKTRRTRRSTVKKGRKRTRGRRMRGGMQGEAQDDRKMGAFRALAEQLKEMFTATKEMRNRADRLGEGGGAGEMSEEEAALLKKILELEMSRQDIMKKFAMDPMFKAAIMKTMEGEEEADVQALIKELNSAKEEEARFVAEEARFVAELDRAKHGLEPDATEEELVAAKAAAADVARRQKEEEDRAAAEAAERQRQLSAAREELAQHKERMQANAAELARQRERAAYLIVNTPKFKETLARYTKEDGTPKDEVRVISTDRNFLGSGYSEAKKLVPDNQTFIDGANRFMPKFEGDDWMFT